MEQRKRSGKQQQEQLSRTLLACPRLIAFLLSVAHEPRDCAAQCKSGASFLQNWTFYAAVLLFWCALVFASLPALPLHIVVFFSSIASQPLLRAGLQWQGLQLRR